MLRTIGDMGLLVRSVRDGAWMFFTMQFPDRATMYYWYKVMRAAGRTMSDG
jgi:hypothetical protein